VLGQLAPRLLGACPSGQLQTSSGCVDVTIGGVFSGSVNANVAYSAAGAVAAWAPNINLPPGVLPTGAQYAAAAANPEAYGRQLLNQYGKQYSDQYGAQYATDISQATVYLNSQASRDLFAGAQSVADGKPLTKQQIQAAFTTAATVGTAITVASTTGIAITAALATASVVFAPIALVVFGGGALIEAGLRAIFGPDSTPKACSPQDPTLRGKDPSDPNWRPYNVGAETWIPISDGAFERWARPILLSIWERQVNCQQVPGISKPGDLCRFYAGLIAIWNSMFPGSPRRRIDPASFFLSKFGNLKYENYACPGTGCLTPLPNTKWNSANWTAKDPGWRLWKRYADDPIVEMSRQLFGCPEVTGRATPAIYDPVNISSEKLKDWILMQFLPLSVAAPLTTTQKILLVAAPVAVAPFAYAWYRGNSVESVLSGVWRATLSVFR
jgi:hypothetical protein